MYIDFGFWMFFVDFVCGCFVFCFVMVSECDFGVVCG